MRIRAVRLASVGTFAEPVALEGLSGALDVLAGPNEMGKSTIFRALQAVFLNAHSSVKGLEILRARHGGGEPLIEADFETGDGGRWRIRKQFGRGKLALLSDLGAGRVVARGPDADARVLELIGASDEAAGGLPMLWVGQKELLSPNADKDRQKEERKQHGFLSSLIQQEIESVAVGPEVRLVRQSVEARLDELLTSRGPKKNGPLDLAVRERDRLARELSGAQDDARQAAARLDELVRLRNRQLGEASPARRSALAEALSAASKDVEEGAKRAQLLALAVERERTLALECERAGEPLMRFDRALAVLAELAAQDTAATAASVSLREAMTALDDELAAAMDQRVRLEQAGHDAAAVLDQVKDAETRAGEGQRLAALSRRLDTARKIGAEIVAGETALAANRATGERVELLDACEQRMALATARLEAAAASVRIDYAPGGAGKVRFDGAMAAGGVERLVSAPLSIEIAGVGTITVRPPPGDHEALRAAIAGDEALRRRLLAEIGAADLTAARGLAAARAQAERALVGARATLVGVVGDGLEALIAEHEALRTRLADAPALPACLPARDEVESRLAALRLEYGAAREAVAALERQREAKLLEITRREADAAARAARRSDAESELPAQDAREATRVKLSAAAEAARARANEALRAVVAVRETAPDRDTLAALGRQRDEAEAALRRFDDTAGKLNLEVEKLQGRVEEADEQETALNAARLAGEHERASAEVTRLEDEVAALKLLLEALHAAESRSRDRFLQPVVDRLTPYLGFVFPDARLAFGDGLTIAGLERAGAVEQLASLSDGTQEQLAVIVRLAFGRLLSDAGRPVPLILDDALVYADDQRIARLFDALRSAAVRHQVLIMTCHESAFAGLGGTRVALSSWAGA